MKGICVAEAIGGRRLHPGVECTKRIEAALVWCHEVKSVHRHLQWDRKHRKVARFLLRTLEAWGHCVQIYCPVQRSCDELLSWILSQGPLLLCHNTTILEISQQFARAAEGVSALCVTAFLCIPARVKSEASIFVWPNISPCQLSSFFWSTCAA